MNIDSILSRLEKVKPTGKDKWIACCPAHDDKTPSLAVTVVDNTVLFKCFSGCGGLEVIDALEARGCEKSDFFPEKIVNRSSLFATPPGYYYNKNQLDELTLQVNFVYFCAEDMLEGRPIKPADLDKARRCFRSVRAELPRLKNSVHTDLSRKANLALTMIQDIGKRYAQHAVV